MRVIKFGGSSLGSGERFSQVANIILAKLNGQPLTVVLSAPFKITDQLYELLNLCNQQLVTDQALRGLERRLNNLTDQIADCQPDSARLKGQLRQALSQPLEKIHKILKGAELLGNCPEQSAVELLTSGEKISVALMKQLLQHLSQQVQAIDPAQFVVAEDIGGDPVANLENCRQLFRQNYAELSAINLMPGFYGKNSQGQTITLGRNGSDYSAAIVAACVNAQECEIWTDVDGVYSADPNIVECPNLVSQMSYTEAMELSYFGASVLHPKTILPLAQADIPCVIKNTLAPDAKGTRIAAEAGSETSIKALTNLDDVSLIRIAGPGMRGMVGMASRVFGAIGRAKISVILITQSSSEYDISICVDDNDAESAANCLRQEFKLELSNGLLEPLAIEQKLAVLSLVGDGMRAQRGVAAKFFTALAQARVNVIAIAQDSSERSISAVIRAPRVVDAVKTCHQRIFLQQSDIDVFVLGCGTVGSELLRQIKKQQPSLLAKNIRLRVLGIANSKGICLDGQGIALDNWQVKQQANKQAWNIRQLAEFVETNHLINPVIVDCTTSAEIADQYADFLAAKFHVVAANKKANTDSFERYQFLRNQAAVNGRRFLYETNVGAGLPVIDNLQGLVKAGDELEKFEGILSGSLSYIFGELSNGLSLSEATGKARELGYTEPNPAEDLSGLDVARKLLIIAREFGLTPELDDIRLESIIPNDLAKIDDADEFMTRLPEIDQETRDRVETANSQNKVLRYVAKIDKGECSVSIAAVDSSHPLSAVAEGENALSVHTQYYQPKPFVIRGYGAGAAVTAAGIFGDILRTQAWVQEQ